MNESNREEVLIEDEASTENRHCKSTCVVFRQQATPNDAYYMIANIYIFIYKLGNKLIGK